MVREGGGRDPGLWDLILELIRVLLRGCLAACVLQWQVVASCAPGVSAPCGGDGLCECLSGARDVLGIRGITKGLLGTAGKLAGGQKVIGVMEKLYFLCVFPGEEKTQLSWKSSSNCSFFVTWGLEDLLTTGQKALREGLAPKAIFLLQEPDGGHLVSRGTDRTERAASYPGLLWGTSPGSSGN